MNENKVIIPTNGRQVWFYGLPPMAIPNAPCAAKLSEQPMAATVIHVHGDRRVNLDVIDHMGAHHFVSSCLLLQDGDPPSAERCWAEWMPYQKGQAAKTEQAEAKAQAAVPADDRALLPFDIALDLLKQGAKVARLGWNGKGLWLELQVPDAHSKMTLPYIFMSYPEDAANTPGARVPWLASQTDMLAEDWVVVA